MMAIAGALGLAVQFVPDPNTKVAHRWERRSDKCVHDNGLIGKGSSNARGPSCWPGWRARVLLSVGERRHRRKRAATVHRLNKARLARRAGTSKAA
jgi:hypothetical protein